MLAPPSRELLAEVLGHALASACQMPGPAWAQIAVDLEELRAALGLPDTRRARRVTEHDAEDAVFDAGSLLRVVDGDESWVALRDARLAGTAAVLKSIARARSVRPSGEAAR